MRGASWPWLATMFSWPSQLMRGLPNDPPEKSCTKRTPRSSSRRASRQPRPKSADSAGRARTARAWPPFRRRVRDFGHGQLHLGGQFVAAHPRRQRVVGAALGGVAAIHARQQLARRAFARLVDRSGRGQVVDRRPASSEHHALMPGRQKAVGPIDRAAGRQSARVGNHDERRQLVGLGSQSVRQPRAERRKAVQSKAAVLLERGRRVVRRFRHHRAG